MQLIPTAYYSTSPSGLASMIFYKANLVCMGLEALSLGGLWLAIRSTQAAWRRIGVALSLLGWMLTYCLYD